MKGAEISRHISWAFEITYGVRREMTGFFTQAVGVSDDETGRTSISQTSKRPQLIRECSKFLCLRGNFEVETSQQEYFQEKVPCKKSIVGAYFRKDG